MKLPSSWYFFTMHYLGNSSFRRSQVNIVGDSWKNACSWFLRCLNVKWTTCVMAVRGWLIADCVQKRKRDSHISGTASEGKRCRVCVWEREIFAKPLTRLLWSTTLDSILISPFCKYSKNSNARNKWSKSSYMEVFWYVIKFGHEYWEQVILIFTMLVQKYITTFFYNFHSLTPNICLNPENN